MTPPPNRRRDKPQLSCNTCRRQKVKCDRQQPCSTCVNRGHSQSCTYPSGTVLQNAPDRPKENRRGYSRSTVEGRIQELEKLVVNLMQQASSPSSYASVDTSAFPSPIATQNDFPITGIAGYDIITKTSESNSVSSGGSDQWAAILDSISELKGLVKDDADAVEATQSVASHHVPGPRLLYGSSRPIEKPEILASIPPRPVVDRIISKYFNSMELAPYCLHSGQFMQQYQEFWKDPGAAPIMWIGLLFAIMCVVKLAQQMASGPAGLGNTQAALVETFRDCIVQCLKLGRYTQPGPFVLETLVIYINIEQLLCEDDELGIYMVLGITVQLAMRMGYHRDAAHVPAFQGEMRRRVWATIYQADIVISEQMGMRRLIREQQVDKVEPRNLVDADFSSTVVELPPSRPETDVTPVLFIIAKYRILSVWTTVYDAVAPAELPSYDEIMRIDQMLHDGRSSLPTHFQWRSLAESITDPPHTVMQRIWFEITFYHLQIILHRQYILQHGHSREVSIKAAVKVLEFQHFIDEETHPFGQLCTVWWGFKSVITYSFLLGTSVLCTYLKQSRGASAGVGPTRDGRLPDGVTVDKVKTLLRRSLAIWRPLSSAGSKESQKAIEAVRIIRETEDGNSDMQIDAGDTNSSLDPVDHHLADFAHLPLALDLMPRNCAFTSSISQLVQTKAPH
ncbi:uncharacterized protein BCR38DRAFT_419689 [Pseudomassariella vexata]|uniref:Zn(2)-C6 fungal-type domain-containing protein n=1 Tax=Pseudomassariella vexata TaxID=1141098 RepID=A0A1Y2EEF3_9PEZI|nr:uncharacterized protein BCR38DRAFT_419689 [Pseudomassariella vexata]ORY69646.1 hypothetical protein BCR38DRAFT_419689 [Pseudomassariella vexata]